MTVCGHYRDHTEAQSHLGSLEQQGHPASLHISSTLTTRGNGSPAPSPSPKALPDSTTPRGDTTHMGH